MVAIIMRLILTDPLVNRRSAWPRLACGCALLLAFAGNARQAAAELFQFSTTVSVGATTAISPGVTVNLAGINSDVNQENMDPTGEGTDIVFGSISIAGLTHNFSPSLAVPVSIPFTFQLVIHDFGANFGPPGISPAPASATFDISGTVSGSMGPGNKANISSIVYLPIQVGGPVGSSDTFTIDLGTYVPPGPNTIGAFGAHVTATTSNIPEPATLTLMGLGALTLATPAFRRWRRKPSSSG